MFSWNEGESKICWKGVYNSALNIDISVSTSETSGNVFLFVYISLLMLSENIAARLKMADLLYFIGLEHIVEKPVLQNSIIIMMQF